jgi:hypothetical protein
MKVIMFAPTIIILFMSKLLSGQINCCCNDIEKSASGPFLPGELFVPGQPVDITTYFNQEWLEGDIFLSSGEIVRNKSIKYNGFLDELFWHEPGSENIIKLDKEAIRQFHYLNFNGDTSVYFRKIKIKLNSVSDSAEIFVQKIYDGNLSLFVSHTFYIDRRELVYSKGITLEKEIYREKLVYYLRSANNRTFVTTNLSPGGLSAFFPGKKEKIRGFFRLNKLGKIISNSDLIRVTQFLGTL